MYNYSHLDAQSEIARRREFVSEGLQVAQWLGSFVSNCLRRSRGRLLEVVSDRLASLRRRACAQSQQPHSVQS